MQKNLQTWIQLKKKLNKQLIDSYNATNSQVDAEFQKTYEEAEKHSQLRNQKQQVEVQQMKEYLLKLLLEFDQNEMVKEMKLVFQLLVQEDLNRTKEWKQDQQQI